MISQKDLKKPEVQNAYRMALLKQLLGDSKTKSTSTTLIVSFN